VDRARADYHEDRKASSVAARRPIVSVMNRRRLLLTGATGFAGRALHPALVAAGGRVRCLTRDAARARRRHPGHDWVEGNVADREAVARALDGCDAAFYLVHSMREGGDYRRRDRDAARAFADAAAAAGVERIVYLGGVAPAADGASEHLQSRLEVGETLRAGAVPTLELRASMIIGYGSLSWLTVRDLAARLPVMVLPRWLGSRTQPVAIDDVVVALTRALEVPLDASAAFDVPGPQTLSGRQILEETARQLGRPLPFMIEVPLLTPRLSALWVRLVTRANWNVAREIVVGLEHDLLARDDRYWTLIDHTRRLGFAEAARRALAEERAPAGGPWGAVERVLPRVDPRGT